MFKFSVDLQRKKKVILPNCSTYLLVFSWFPKKSYHLETAARESLGGHAGHFGGRRPFLPPPPPLVAALGVTNLSLVCKKLRTLTHQ